MENYYAVWFSVLLQLESTAGEGASIGCLDGKRLWITEFKHKQNESDILAEQFGNLAPAFTYLSSHHGNIKQNSNKEGKSRVWETFDCAFMKYTCKLKIKIQT
jgi:hypothetical protein